MNTNIREQFFSRSNPIWLKTKLAFLNGGYERLLEAIEGDLIRLQRLIEMNSRAAPVRQEARKKLIQMPWRNIQAAAGSLFEAISTGWRCKCTDCHSSFLRLNAPARQTSNQLGGSYSFALLVPNESRNPLIAGPIGWWRLDIESHSVPQKAKYISPTPGSMLCGG
jgi:hypothetical protein